MNFCILRCPAAVWPSNVVDEHLGGAPPPELGISKRTSGHRRRDRELLVCFYIHRGTNDFHGFSSHFAFGRFVFRCARHTQETLETSRAVRAFKKTFMTRITLETFVAFETPEAPIAFETGVRFLNCPEVGSYFLLSGASSKMMSSSWFFSSLFVCRRRSRVRTCRSKFRSRGPPGNVPFRASPGGLRKQHKCPRGSPGPKAPPK